jgi:energy-coupling factor transport system ATP-binding protein
VALELTGVSYTYAEGTDFARQALSDVDISVASGEVMLVLGPTGSGKSTLLKVAAGLLKPVAGTASIDGSPVDASAAGRAGGVGLVFQSPENQLFAETVADDVAFGPKRQGLDDAEAYTVAQDTLARCGLDPDAFGLRSPFSLSGGEARRAALAGTLATRPGYLLLDEPTAGLDARGRDTVMDAIAQLNDVGIVIVTHDVEQFLGLAKGVLVLSEGTVRLAGTVRDIASDPSRLRAAGLELPAVLSLMERARERYGADVPLTSDPMEAARALAAERGRAT